LLAGRESRAPRPGESVLQVVEHAGVTLRQFGRDLIVWSDEILQGLAGGRIANLARDFPNATKESGGRAGREAVVFLAGLNVTKPREIAKPGTRNDLLESMLFTLQAPAFGVLRKEADQQGNYHQDGLYE
jgi:hypothetical protein